MSVHTISKNLKGWFIAVCAVAYPAAAQAASYEFTWVGAGGYKIEGAFSIPDDLAQSKYIDETVVNCFQITGYHNADVVGDWTLGQLMPETRWVFNFEPTSLRIRTGGASSSGPYGQEWNMNGAGRGCGVDGFGFNVGGFAQDVCVNDRLIRASQVAPRTPLKAKRNDQFKFDGDSCVYALVT